MLNPHAECNLSHTCFMVCIIVSVLLCGSVSLLSHMIYSLELLQCAPAGEHMKSQHCIVAALFWWMHQLTSSLPDSSVSEGSDKATSPELQQENQLSLLQLAIE